MAPGSSIPAETLARYERLVATQPGLERKGTTMPYTSIKGNMSSFVSDEGVLALRLPPEDRERFLATYASTLHEAHGTVMKEYVSVPGGLFEDHEALEPWFAASCAYVGSLKPKSTKRPSPRS